MTGPARQIEPATPATSVVEVHSGGAVVAHVHPDGTVYAKAADGNFYLQANQSWPVRR
jgi:hypothetical protein